MTGTQDFFPGFRSLQIETEAGRLFARVGGNGPPLLCLHGFPETHAMWTRVAPELSRRFTLVVPDLPGYGDSDIPPAEQMPAALGKSAIGRVMTNVMAQLRFPAFDILGHDRGARIAYRMLLDSPSRIRRAVVLDIIPTLDVWESFANPEAARLMAHWTFLAQPAPLPETLIAAAADHWLESRFVRGGGARPSWLTDDLWEHYKAVHSDPLRQAAHCDDYRAGATIDLDDDIASRKRGELIQKPLMVLWGSRGNLATHADPLAIWRRWCPAVIGGPIDSSHYIPEENPDGLLAAILPFLEAG